MTAILKSATAALSAPELLATAPATAPTTAPRPSAAPAPALTTEPRTSTFRGEIAVCSVSRLICGRGVAALLPDGRQVAVYLVDDNVHAICNIDPVARAAVMSRGLVGDRAGVPAVISPIGKQAYSLHDGRGLDDPGHGVSVFRARVAADGTVVVATEAAIRHTLAA